MMMFICQSLIVVKNATSSGSKVVKIDGKKDGDQMQITKKRLKQIISEEMERLSEMPMQGSGLGAALDFKQIIDKYGLSMEEAMMALKSAFNPSMMQESEKRNK